MLHLLLLLYAHGTRQMTGTRVTNKIQLPSKGPYRHQLAVHIHQSLFLAVEIYATDVSLAAYIHYNVSHATNVFIAVYLRYKLYNT